MEQKSSGLGCLVWIAILILFVIAGGNNWLPSFGPRFFALRQVGESMIGDSKPWSELRSDFKSSFGFLFACVTVVGLVTLPVLIPVILIDIIDAMFFAKGRAKAEAEYRRAVFEAAARVDAERAGDSGEFGKYFRRFGTHSPSKIREDDLALQRREELLR